MTPSTPSPSRLSDIRIKPIRTDAEHAEALRQIDALWGAAPGSPEGDTLDVLATLMDAYENSRWPEAEIHPIDLLKTVMEETGRKQTDLAEVIGSRSRASEILNLRRTLNVDMIWKISSAWGIPAELLIKPYSPIKAA
jgi:HTH-type transcriptional regulator / antitoxin HigA